MRFSKIFIILSLLALPGFVLAQKKSNSKKNNNQKQQAQKKGDSKKNENKPIVANSLDDKFTPDKNSVFNLKNSSNGSGENNNDGSDYSNVIKFNPTLLTRRTAALFYERRLGETVGLQAGLGFCYGIDVISGLGASSDVSFSSDKSSISLETMIMKGRANGMGLFLSLSSRFYYTSLFFDNNSYFELNYRYNSNKINLDAIYQKDPYSIFDGNTEVITRTNWYNLVWGSYFSTEGNVITTHEFYYGVGIKKTTFDSYVFRNSSNNSSIHIYSKTTDRESAYGFTMVLGYVFGIAFK